MRTFSVSPYFGSHGLELVEYAARILDEYIKKN
jgi:hypothetical protein